MSELTLAQCVCAVVGEPVHGATPPSKRAVNAVSFTSKWPSFMFMLMYVTALPPNKEVEAGWIPVSDKSLGEVCVCVCARVCSCTCCTLKYSFH